MCRLRLVMCGFRVMGIRSREVAVQETHSAVLLHLHRRKEQQQQQQKEQD